MIQLNLKADSPELQAIKDFLQENANKFLAEKINNGVYIQKDGKHLLNKKDLASFMKYACEEARKLSEKGASSACIKDEIVFGWAMHYFEENDIIGTLYNEDGSEYKPTPKKVNKPVQSVHTPLIPTKPAQPKSQQFNLFDMITQAEKSEKTPVEEANNSTELNVDLETGEILPPIEEKKNIPVYASPLYQKYMRFQNDYPLAVIAYRLGDFFEVFGDNAVKLANNFNLTLTGRDCGLKERIPMVGFPYHASDMYFHKISERFELIVVEDNVAKPYENEIEDFPNTENESTMYENNPISNDDIEDLRTSVKAFEQTALCTLLEIFGDELIIPEEDY